MSDDYEKEIIQANAELADLRERSSEALGEDWESFRKRVFSPEEIASSNIRVALIMELVKARKERGISQKKLEELSGVKQPIIARMEKGGTSPQLDTILRVLAPLGKTLYLGDLQT